MAKRLFSRFILSPNNHLIKPTLQNVVRNRKLHTEGIPVKEIQIPVQWGYVAGKLWGNEQERPILALHGWQDNAGTWDPLAPMLIKNINRPILALDLPGHGQSSWIPPGMHYYSWEYPRLVLELKEYFKWDKVSILAHSMGSICSFRFASLFPDDVDFYIAIDSLVHDDYDLNLVIEKYPILLKKLHIAQTRLDQEPPAYTWEELIKIWHLGTRKSVDLNSVPYLLKRGTKPSTKEPNKFYFCRDSRLKHTLFNPEDKKLVENLAKRLKCPTLYIKGTDSPYAIDDFAVEMREVIEQNNDKFESHFLPGTHHLHLNTPEVVLPHIIKFLNKYNFLK